MIERWRPAPGGVPYMVSDHGRVWKKGRGHISAVVWAAHIAQALALSRRLERLERWKRGLVCWQTARVWVQMELPWGTT